MGNYELLHNFENMKRNDEADLKDGTKITVSPEQLPSEVQLGNNIDEIKATLTNLLPGIDEATLESLANEALSQGIKKDKLSEFASLKLETMDTGAIHNQKDFVQKVDTPTLKPQTNNTKEVVDRNEEGR